MPPKTSYKKKVYRKKKASTSKTMYSRNSNLVRLIKSVSLRQQETKQAMSSATNVQLHNVSVRYFANMLGTQQGITDGLSTSNRIGDSITPIGIKQYWQFRMPSDRPNVTFKVWILKHAGDANPPTFVPLKAITGINLLDPVDSEKVTVVKIFTVKPPESYFNGTVGNSKENCIFRKIWIPLPRTEYKYSQDNAALGKNYQLALYVSAYDTVGSLITDNIGSCTVSNILYFKDA